MRGQYTLGDLAKQHNVPVHRIRYVVESRGIKPVDRIGIYRVFDEAAAAEVARELAQVDAHLARFNRDVPSDRRAG